MLQKNTGQVLHAQTEVFKLLTEIVQYLISLMSFKMDESVQDHNSMPKPPFFGYFSKMRIKINNIRLSR